MPVLPLLRAFEQHPPQPVEPDPALAVRRALTDETLASIPLGARVAVALGSRGLASGPVLAAELIAALRRAGARPFIIPAMGSHGGATPQGQAAMLDHLGLGGAALGCEVRAEMETEIIGEAPPGFPIHVARPALEADAVIPLNRVKSHARFVGDYESGLLKMLIVGLGKREGAAAVHRFCRATIDPLVRAAAPVVLGRVRVPFGLAVVENACHQVAHVRAIAGPRLIAEEPEILRLAKRLLPRLPAAEVDLLVVDRIGKDVSGTGMETFVIGQRPDSPTRVAAIVALDLTQATAGNAHGVGFAIYTTQRLWDKVDHAATRANAMTAQRPEGARLPIPLPTDREAVLAGLEIAGGPDARVVHILDTANLTRFQASAALWDELAAAPHVQAVSAPFEMPFDAAGRLRPVECPRAC